MMVPGRVIVIFDGGSLPWCGLWLFLALMMVPALRTAGGDELGVILWRHLDQFLQERHRCP